MERFPVIAIVGMVMGLVPSPARIVGAVRAAGVAVAVVVVVNSDVIVAEEPVVISTVVVVVAAAMIGRGIGVINAGTEKQGTEWRQERGQGTLHEHGTVRAHTLFGERGCSQYGIRR